MCPLDTAEPGSISRGRSLRFCLVVVFAVLAAGWSEFRTSALRNFGHPATLRSAPGIGSLRHALEIRTPARDTSSLVGLALSPRPHRGASAREKGDYDPRPRLLLFARVSTSQRVLSCPLVSPQRTSPQRGQVAGAIGYRSRAISLAGSALKNMAPKFADPRLTTWLCRHP